MEGNIGSGKSTAARKLGKRLGYRVLDEPVDDELLAAFYKDKKTWAYTFQMAMLHKRWRLQMLAAVEEPGAIVDRSLWGDMVFARLHTEAGNIHPIHWATYAEAVKNMCLVLFPPTLLVYLTTDPETCMERIKRRNRPQEKDITVAYLKSVDDGYNRLIEEAKIAFYPWSHAVEVMPIPWDVDIATEQQWDRTANTLEKAIARRSLPDYIRRPEKRWEQWSRR
jgi:deoxyadenosine/deoxycytidine kinase